MPEKCIRHQKWITSHCKFTFQTWSRENRSIYVRIIFIGSEFFTSRSTCWIICDRRFPVLSERQDQKSNSIQKHLCLFLLIEFYCIKLSLRIKLWYLIYNWRFHVLKVTYHKSREYPLQVTKKIALYFFSLKLKLSIYLVAEI